MDQKAVGLLGAVAGLATVSAAHAAANPTPDVSRSLQPSSYAELLAPVQDAVALLKADDAARAQVQEVQGYAYYNYGPPPYAYYQPYYQPYAGYYYYHHHHHHHHHHFYHHHHHHRGR